MEDKMTEREELRRRPTATYRSVKVGRRHAHERYRAVVRAIDGSTSTVGKREYRSKEAAVAVAQASIDSTRGAPE